MEEHNPYHPPRAPVADQAPPSGAWRLVEPRTLPAGSGWDWIAAGWRYFMMNPGIWVVNGVVYFVIALIVGVMPFVSGILNTLFAPVFIGGLTLGCRGLDEGRELRVDHLFAGFRRHLGSLIGVGGGYLLGMMVVGLCVVIVVIMTFGLPVLLHPGLAAAGPVMAVGGIMLAVLVGVVLMAPLLMAYWFAPLLVVLNDVPPFEAMRMSFRASLVNMWPLTIYGLLMFVFGLLASLPLFLGLLVFFPVTWASTYAAYKAIFLEPVE